MGAAGLIAEQDKVGAGAVALYGLAQGEFAKAGFGISSINITGQTLTSEAEILKALDIGPATSTLNYDADAALTRIEALPSVQSANIRKVYPSGLSVSIVEKQPMARWRIGDKTYLVGEDEASIQARTRAHTGFLERGRHLEAARSAFWLAFVLANVPDQRAQAAGWLARAQRLIDSMNEPCVEHGWLLCALARQRVSDGDITFTGENGDPLSEHGRVGALALLEHAAAARGQRGSDHHGDTEALRSGHSWSYWAWP